MRRRVILLSITLIAFIAVTRAANHASFLYGWDSVQFALSIEDYNVRAHQPHPPGYILYSFTLKILNSIIRDHNKIILMLNVVAEILACLFIGLTIVHLLPDDVRGRVMIAGCGAFVYATNPISWFYSSVAEIYAIEGLLVSLTIYLFLQSFRNPKYLLYGSVAMAITGGFRPTTEVFLIPFYLMLLVRNPGQRILSSLLILVIGNFIWLGATIILYGGINEFFIRIFWQFLSSANATSPLFSEMGRNSLKLLSYGLLQAVTLPILIALIIRLLRVKSKMVPAPLVLFLIAPILVFSFIHYPKVGYLLLIIPVLITIVVVLLGRLYQLKMAVAILVFSSLMNVALFNGNFGSSKQGTFREALRQLGSPNRKTITGFNRSVSGFLSSVSPLPDRKIFIYGPEGFPDWRMLMYYFPNDQAILISASNKGKKRWASFAEHHKSSFIHTQLLLDDTIRTAVFITTQAPPVPATLFKADERLYWFSRRRELPREFQIQGFRFIRE